MAEPERKYDFKAKPLEKIEEAANFLLKLTIDTKNELGITLSDAPLETGPYPTPYDRFYAGVQQIHKKLIEELHALDQAMEG
jgi:hypothetical protein